jgi:hypothetical protein
MDLCSMRGYGAGRLQRSDRTSRIPDFIGLFLGANAQSLCVAQRLGACKFSMRPSDIKLVGLST